MTRALWAMFGFAALALAPFAACTHNSSSTTGADGTQIGADGTQGGDQTQPDAILDSSPESDQVSGGDLSSEDSVSDAANGDDTSGSEDGSSGGDSDDTASDDALTPPAPNACSDPKQCESPVLYFKEVKTESDCYCPSCDNQTVHLNKETHALYKASWEKLCQTWIVQNPCPKAPCLLTIPRTCVDGSCQPDVSNPSACEDTVECRQNTVYDRNVTKVEECYCPGCDDVNVSLNETTAVIYELNWKLYCTDWAKQNPCAVPKCLAPAYRECKDKTCQVKPDGCSSSYECTQNVIYYKPVLSEADCYCVGCDNDRVSLTERVHQLYTQQWNEHCTEWAKTHPCPDALCIKNSPRICLNETCVSTRACTVKEDCQQGSTYVKPVASIDQCYCTSGCLLNTPISKVAHELYQKQWKTNCTTWVPDTPCPVGPGECSPPSPVDCTDGLCTILVN
ncbi:MAG: hypothetical protein KC609_24175 [Myxococcales bacterium]|nr:hypothetical protein [Myxococcales bacterium]